MILWLGAVAAGETWSVADPALEAPLQAALAEAWPHRADVELRVGAPDGAALVWDGLRVTWTAPDGQVRSAPADDPAVVVLLARTWTLGAPPPAGPTFLPERPPPPAPIRLPPPPPPPPRRWSVGLGARALVGPPRLIDGIRAVGQVTTLRGRTAAEAALGVAPSPGSYRLPDRGAVDTFWADRVTLGVAAVGVVPLAGPVSLRGAVGPEVRWSEHWLYADGNRATATGFPRAAVVGSLGASARFGPWEFVAVGLGRLSTAAPRTDAPGTDAGFEVDLRLHPRR